MTTATETAAGYEEQYTYDGSTVVERIRRENGQLCRRDWLVFDDVESAEEFFYAVA